MNPIQPDRMLMVYNADEGLFNAINDWAHKFFSPETYECPLCRFTYGMAGMLVPWKTFLEKQGFPVTFHYRPYFRKSFPQFENLQLPVILVEHGGVVEPFLLADEINQAGGLVPLINLVETRLENWQPLAK